MSKRKLICTININDIIDIKAADHIIQDIKNKASDEQRQFPIILRGFKSSDSDIVRVKFMVSPFELENYCDFSVDNEGLGHASVYATERNIKELDGMIKEMETINSSDIFEKLCKSFARIGTKKVEVSTINNDEKDFEYICNRCGVKVKTPNTLRGPVNVVDFYREVEDEVGDSVSYRLCQECMQDFFGFLSCN